MMSTTFNKALLTAGIAVILTGCSRTSPGAGEQAVLIEKPLLFGHGGVDPTPVTAGSSYIALTTDYVIVDMKPVRYDEAFEDLMSQDAQPMSFHAVIVLQVTDSVEMISKFGEKWYETNVQRQFQNFMRNEAKQFNMIDLAVKQTDVHTLEQNVKSAVTAHLTVMGIPARVIEVTVGRVSPPQNVVNQQKLAAEEQQRIITEHNRKLAEDARMESEASRAAADQAYQNKMGLSPAQFVQLETAKLCSTTKNCQMYFGASPTPIVSR